MVIAIHREWCALIAEDRGESRGGLHVEWMRECRYCWIRRTNLSIYMLQQAATAMHIQELHAAADAEDRQLSRIGGGDRLPLQRVTRCVHLHRAINRLVVAIGMDICTAGEEQPLRAGEGGGTLRRGCVR